jgi:hypothetical protein
VVVTCTAHTSETPNRRYFGALLFVLTAEIPAGATVDACYLTVQANALAADDPNVDIHLEDVADADDLTTAPDVTSRVPTSASAQWTATGIGTSPVDTPSLVAPLQELVDTYGGLANGATLCFLVRGRNDALSTFAVVSLEGTGAPAAVHIEFTAAGGTDVAGEDGLLGQSAEAGAIVQTHLVGAVDLFQAQTAENGAVSTETLIGAMDSSLAQSVANGAILQTHVVGGAAGVLGQLAEAGGLAQTHLVGAVDGFLPQSVDFGLLPSGDALVRIVTLAGEFETVIVLAGEFEMVTALAGEFESVIVLAGEL